MLARPATLLVVLAQARPAICADLADPVLSLAGLRLDPLAASRPTQCDAAQVHDHCRVAADIPEVYRRNFG
jgi:hypothetical protein